MIDDRLGARAIEELRERLSHRDLAILRSVNDHRFLTTKQIARLHFSDHATALAGIRACVRVLGRLRGHRLLARLDRQVGGVRAGSASFVWCLDVVGERLTRRTKDEREIRRRFFEPSTVFLAHTLAVAETRLILQEAASVDGFEVVTVTTEPMNWRTYLGPAGGVETLKPDLYVVTRTAQWDEFWFIEVDRGTESIPVLLRKCRQYDRYRRTGQEQARHGVFPRVLWVLPSSRRRAQLEAVLGQSADLAPQLFQVASPEMLVSHVAPQASKVDQMSVEPL